MLYIRTSVTYVSGTRGMQDTYLNGMHLQFIFAFIHHIAV